jgi:hypothetical protein
MVKENSLGPGKIPELPGAVTQGATLEEARDNIKDAIALLLQSYREDAIRQAPAGAVVETLCIDTDHPFDLRGDENGGGVPVATVYDTMPYRQHFLDLAQRGRGARAEVVKDAGGRILVLLQVQLLANLWLPLAVEDQPSRFCRPVDASLGQQSSHSRITGWDRLCSQPVCSKVDDPITLSVAAVVMRRSAETADTPTCGRPT